MFILLMLACKSDGVDTDVPDQAGLLCGADGHPHVRWQAASREPARITYLSIVEPVFMSINALEPTTCAEVVFGEHACGDVGWAFVGAASVRGDTVPDCIPGTNY